MNILQHRSLLQAQEDEKRGELSHRNLINCSCGQHVLCHFTISPRAFNDLCNDLLSRDTNWRGGRGACPSLCFSRRLQVIIPFIKLTELTETRICKLLRLKATIWCPLLRHLVSKDFLGKLWEVFTFTRASC